MLRPRRRRPLRVEVLNLVTAKAALASAALPGPVPGVRFAQKNPLASEVALRVAAESAIEDNRTKRPDLLLTDLQTPKLHSSDSANQTQMLKGGARREKRSGTVNE